jgi:hypothetical protein
MRHISTGRQTATGRASVVRWAALGALAVGSVACSSEDVAEQLVEQAIEEQGEDVDIDLDDGELRIETPDGSMVIDVSEDGDGSFSIEGGDGTGNFSIEGEGDDGVAVVSTPDGEMVIGGDELPGDFPADVPVPDGLTIESVVTASGTAGTSFTITGTVSDDAETATDAYVAALDGAGYTQQSITRTPDGAFFDYRGAEWRVAGGFFDDTTGSTGTFANINVYREG